MKSSDKRIGNYVFHYPGFDSPQYKQPRFLAKITSLSEAGVSGYSILEKHPDGYHKSIEEIPLTEEWLLKLGFEIEYKSEWTHKYSISVNDKITIKLKPEKTFLFRGMELAELKSVHQLQNLYFALTGEELTLEQSGE